MRPPALLAPLFLSLALAACTGRSSAPPSSGASGGVGSAIGGSPGQDPDARGAGGALRTPLVPQSHALFARMEAPSDNNDCNGDSECLKGGCSGETCAAVAVVSTCEQTVQVPNAAACGCVSGQCIWYTTDGKTLPDNAGGPGGAGPICGDKSCAPNEQCIAYYGIAGPSGPRFQECGIPCAQGKPNGGCPDGMRCQTIADGPGPVCR